MFECIGDQIDEHLLHLVPINPQRKLLYVRSKVIYDLFTLGVSLEIPDNLTDELHQISFLNRQHLLVVLYLTEIKYLVHNLEKVAGIMPQCSDILLDGRVLHGLFNLIKRIEDKSQRRSDFM